MANSGPFTRLSRPPRQTGNWDVDAREMFKWFDRIWLILSGIPGIAWDIVSKAGSNITDIETRQHNDLEFKRVTTDVDYAIGYQDTTVFADASSAALTTTLPAAADGVGPINIKKIDTSTNFITVAAQAGETLDGSASFDLEYQDESVTCESDGTQWWVV